MVQCVRIQTQDFFFLNLASCALGLNKKLCTYYLALHKLPNLSVSQVPNYTQFMELLKDGQTRHKKAV